MEWFNRVVMGEIHRLMDSARANYGVDPVVFIVIYLVSVPFFYYSIFRMVRGLARKAQGEIITWSMVFLAATAAPFLYVLFFGHGLPWWVYGIIALLIGQGVWSLVRRLTGKGGKQTKGDEGTPAPGSGEPPAGTGAGS
jgi:hypothetical protein